MLLQLLLLQLLLLHGSASDWLQEWMLFVKDFRCMIGVCSVAVVLVLVLVLMLMLVLVLVLVFVFMFVLMMGSVGGADWWGRQQRWW